MSGNAQPVQPEDNFSFYIVELSNGYRSVYVDDNGQKTNLIIHSSHPLFKRWCTDAFCRKYGV